tara:strand:- start:522 stop:641 length:120 start_codon:yes stop_codon:yes gene_type:complete
VAFARGGCGAISAFAPPASRAAQTLKELLLARPGMALFV